MHYAQKKFKINNNNKVDQFITNSDSRPHQTLKVLEIIGELDTFLLIHNSGLKTMKKGGYFYLL